MESTTVADNERAIAAAEAAYRAAFLAEDSVSADDYDMDADLSAMTGRPARYTGYDF